MWTKTGEGFIDMTAYELFRNEAGEQKLVYADGKTIFLSNTRPVRKPSFLRRISCITENLIPSRMKKLLS